MNVWGNVWPLTGGCSHDPHFYFRTMLMRLFSLTKVSINSIPPPSPLPPSRHCKDARVYGRTTTAMHEIESSLLSSTPSPRPSAYHPSISFDAVVCVFAGDHSKYDQILLVEIGKYIPGRFFGVYRRSYLVWLPVTMSSLQRRSSPFLRLAGQTPSLFRLALGACECQPGR